MKRYSAKKYEERLDEAARIRRINMAVSDDEGAAFLRAVKTPLAVGEKMFIDFLYETEVKIGKPADEITSYKEALVMLSVLESVFESKCEQYNVLCEVLRNCEEYLLLERSDGWTFAHELASRLLLVVHVAGPEILELESGDGTTVMEVLFEKGFVTEDENEAKGLFRELSWRMHKNPFSMNYYEIALCNFLGFQLGMNDCRLGCQSTGLLAKTVREAKTTSEKRPFGKRFRIIKEEKEESKRAA